MTVNWVVAAYVTFGIGIDENGVRLHLAEAVIHCTQRFHFYPDLQVTPPLQIFFSYFEFLELLTVLTLMTGLAGLGPARATIQSRTNQLSLDQTQ